MWDENAGLIHTKYNEKNKAKKKGSRVSTFKEADLLALSLIKGRTAQADVGQATINDGRAEQRHLLVTSQ